MASEEAARPRTNSVSNDELKRKGSQLKKVTTKEYTDEPSADEVAAIKKVWDEKSATPEALAAHFKLDAGLLTDNFPDDAAQFAKHMFAGLYILDKHEAAKDALRQRLQTELKTTSGKLRKSVTRGSMGPSSDDLAAAAKIYTDKKGDLTEIAKHLSLKEALLNNDPPDNAAQFAEKLLAGNYTDEADEAAKQKLRENLRPELMQKRPSLKKTFTKEFEGLTPEDRDVAMAVKLFPGDDAKKLDELVTKLGISASHYKSKPPTDAQDFAQQLLNGAYAADQAEVLKKELRGKLEAAIRERRPSLNVVPKTKRRLSQVTDEEFQNFGSFFDKHKGDLDKISKESGLPSELLRNAPPANAEDFVLKLMDGLYTFDMDEQAKQNFRACLRREMKGTKDTLKKTTTKEWDGSANEEDIKMFAKVYTARNGDLRKLAELFSLSFSAMEMSPPDNDQDFAKKVLLGQYTPDLVARQIDEFRQSLARQVKTHGRASLKHTETKVSSVQPTAGQIAKVAKIYNDLNGDLAQCCSATSVDFAAVSKNKPTDANDFAVKVLSGAYSTDEAETSRKRLSLVLHQDMLNHPALKVVATEQKTGGPKEEDIAKFSQVFTDQGGNFQKLAAVLGCDMDLLTADAPKDARNFALKYLAGGYQK